MATFKLAEINSIQNVIINYFDSFLYDKNDDNWISFRKLDDIKSIHIFKYSTYYHLMIRTYTKDISVDCNDILSLGIVLKRKLDSIFFHNCNI